MTTATATYEGPLCWECRGPCATYKGSVHGWHCTACIERYLDAAAARAEAKQRKARERLLHRMFHNCNDSTPLTADRRRGDGGPRCVPRRRPGVDPTAVTGTRPVMARDA